MAEWIISHYPRSAEMELMMREEALLPTCNYCTTLFCEINRVDKDIEEVEERGEEKLSGFSSPYEPLVMQILILHAPSHNFLTKRVCLYCTAW
jgi:hypothetical protein